MERRLAAILAADIVGYSRLIRADEDGTLSAIKALRAEIFDPAITKFHGRIIKLMGNGMLVEYPSVLDAVQSAAESQRALSAHNAALADEKRIDVRVGIHLGDVVIDGDDIQGDGVNIASRLEALAEPGGVCVSGMVYESVRDRVEIQFEDRGEQALKNIDRPVPVWHWRPDESPARPEQAAAELSLPDKPSIAVLPFENMSGDPGQEYFSDGITEDIITELSKFRWFFVTARNSSFTYKGGAVDIKQVGRELGVRFVLEGSVRKAGNRVRITAQLIEAATGNHIWAERYDQQMEDIFDLQDEITRTISAAVEPELSNFERESALRKPTENLDAWDLYQRGVAKLWLTDRDGIEEARELMSAAVELDPEFGRAYGHRAYVSYVLSLFGWSVDTETVLNEALSDAKKAITIDRRDYFGHYALGKVLTLTGDHSAALRAMETSLQINPNFVLGYYGMGSAYFWVDEQEKVLEYLDISVRLNPNDPLMWATLLYRGAAQYFLGKIDDAIDSLERCIQFPTAQFPPYCWLAAIYHEIGRSEDAVAMLDKAKQLEPRISIGFLRKIFRSAKGTGQERFFELLQQMGLHE